MLPGASQSGQRVLDSPEPAPLASTFVVELGKRLHRGGRRRRAVAVALLAGLLSLAGTALTTVCWFGAPTARADQIDATRQQITALEASAVASADRIHALTAAYSQASFRAATVNRELAAGRAEVADLQAQTALVSGQLRQEALDSYTGGYIGLPRGPSDGRGPDLVVRAEYVSIASGQLKDSVDRYRASRSQLSAAQVQLLAEQRQSSTALAEVTQARQAALAEAASDQSRLDGLQAQLTRLVAAQPVRQPADSRAAAPSRPAPQGLPVNGGLVAVVKAVVGPSPSPVPASPLSAPTTTLPPAPATTSAPGPTTPAPGASGGDGGAGGVWLQLRECESGDDYQANTGNGFFGAYQFSQQTWTDLGYPGRPDLEPPAMQDAAAQKLQAESGWGQWPACSAALGLS